MQKQNLVWQERRKDGLKTLHQGVLGQPSCFDQECLHFAHSRAQWHWSRVHKLLLTGTVEFWSGQAQDGHRLQTLWGEAGPLEQVLLCESLRISEIIHTFRYLLATQDIQKSLKSFTWAGVGWEKAETSATYPATGMNTSAVFREQPSSVLSASIFNIQQSTSR